MLLKPFIVNDGYPSVGEKLKEIKKALWKVILTVKSVKC